MPEPRLKETFDGALFIETAVEQALREQRRDPQLIRQLTRKQRLRRRQCPTKFHADIFFSRCEAVSERTMAIVKMPATTINDTEVGMSHWNHLGGRSFGSMSI